MVDYNWDNHYRIGVKSIDAQHRILIRMISEVLSFERDDYDNDLLAKTIESLSDYIITHIEFEEKLMEKYNYPGIELHKKEHNALKKKVYLYINNYNEGNSKLLNEIIDHLINWIKNHIINGEDKKLGKYLNSIGITE